MLLAVLTQHDDVTSILNGVFKREQENLHDQNLFLLQR